MFSTGLRTLLSSYWASNSLRVRILRRAMLNGLTSNSPSNDARFLSACCRSICTLNAARHHISVCSAAVRWPCSTAISCQMSSTVVLPIDRKDLPSQG